MPNITHKSQLQPVLFEPPYWGGNHGTKVLGLYTINDDTSLSEAIYETGAEIWFLIAVDYYEAVGVPTADKHMITLNILTDGVRWLTTVSSGRGITTYACNKGEFTMGPIRMPEPHWIVDTIREYVDKIMAPTGV